MVVLGPVASVPAKLHASNSAWRGMNDHQDQREFNCCMDAESAVVGDLYLKCGMIGLYITMVCEGVGEHAWGHVSAGCPWTELFIMVASAHDIDESMSGTAPPPRHPFCPFQRQTSRIIVALKAPVQSDAGFPDDPHPDHLHNDDQVDHDAVDPHWQSARSAIQTLHGVHF